MGKHDTRKNKNAAEGGDDEAVKFRLYLLEALSDDDICQKLSSACAAQNRELADSVKSLADQVSSLRAQLKKRDDDIVQLQTEIQRLTVKHDDLEQYGRRSSVRIQGITAQGADDTDQSVLSLLNDGLEMTPPLQASDIIVSHRVPRRKATDGPLPILVRFRNVPVKARVMAMRSKLRAHRREQNNPIYFNEDLTPRRSKLFARVRKLVKRELITDCWTYNGDIKIKDHSGVVCAITDFCDLQ